MVDRQIVAIHQPNFLPWLGYFDKITRADVFILMDNAQFPKTGGTWINRVRMLIGGKPTWLTVPIVRSYHGVRRICDIEIDGRQPWRVRLLKTIQSNYARAPYFSTVLPMIEWLVNVETASLAEYNIQSIRCLAEALGLRTAKLVLGTSLQVDGRATDLLIAMTKAVGGTAYLCGGGAEGYQEDETFASHDIELVYQHFRHPVYPQGTTCAFYPGLSVVDALMWCGFAATRAMLYTLPPASSVASPTAPSMP
jgi:hypothetical protein